MAGASAGESHHAGAGHLPPRIAQEFESVTDLGEQDVKIGDRVFHRVHLWACYNLK